MKSFKEYLVETTEVPARQLSEQELAKILGKARISQMLKNPFFAQFSNYQKAYKYGVSAAGFPYVEAYFYFANIHRTPEGKIRPEIMVKIVFSYTGSKVINAHKYTRDKEPNDAEKKYGSSAGWTHLSDWKKVE